MTLRSRYVGHLPAVLWENDDASAFSLTTALCLFEKVLTGIDDDVVIEHGDHTHASISSTIDRLQLLYDPWRVPARSARSDSDFLRWLASWVGLDFPAVGDRQSWDEYQRRKATSSIAGIHRLRGLRSGLEQYLDLFNVTAARPRIAIYDGNKLQSAVPTPGRKAPITPLPYPTPSIVYRQGANAATPPTPIVDTEGLVSPQCLTVGTSGELFLGDAGIPTELAKGRIPSIPSRVWRIASGATQFTDNPPVPIPLAPDGIGVAGGVTPFTNVKAVAVRAARGGDPETLYMLDVRSEGPTICTLIAPYDGKKATRLAVPPGTLINPISMAIDNTGDLLVLDRGARNGEAAATKLITLRADGTNPTSKPLQGVSEPLSMLVLPGVDASAAVVVGDGGRAADANANLVEVDRTNPASFVLKTILPDMNPLIAPTGIVRRDHQHLYVLDAGLKPFVPARNDPFVLTSAEPAVIRLLDRSSTPAACAPATESGHFVYPTAMVGAADRLVICDPGPLETSGATVAYPHRALPYEFGVSVHFARPRLPAQDSERKRAKGRILGEVRAIVNQQKPAHTRCTVIGS